MSRIKYLHRAKSGIFHFRRTIPSCLREHYGKREIKLSLKTESRHIAIPKATLLSLRCAQEFEELYEMSKNSIDGLGLITIDEEINTPQGTTTRKIKIDNHELEREYLDKLASP